MSRSAWGGVVATLFTIATWTTSVPDTWRGPLTFLVWFALGLAIVMGWLVTHLQDIGRLRFTEKAKRPMTYIFIFVACGTLGVLSWLLVAKITRPRDNSAAAGSPPASNALPPVSNRLTDPTIPAPAAGAWSIDTPLNGPRVNHIAASFQSSIFTIGGIRQSTIEGQTVRERLRSTEWASVDSDGSLSIWQNGPDTKRERVGSAGFAFAKWLFVVGGENEATVERAEPGSNGIPSWELVGALPAARSQFGVVIAGGRLYVVGGMEQNKVSSDCITADISPNGGIGPWQSAPSLVSPRRGLAVVVANGNVFAIGGNDGDTSLRTVERAQIKADGTLGPWVILERSLKTPREGLAAVVSGETIIVSGGYKAGGEYLASVESATVGATGDITDWDDARFGRLKRPHGYHQAVALGTRVYVVGGGSDKGFTPIVERLEVAR
jgi:hypothetical protein